MRTISASATPSPTATSAPRASARQLEKEYGLTFADHYARTGIQYQPFNTVYQLMALKKEHPEQLAAAKTFLMVPDYLNYLLCGVPANEYTNASTTALVGADSRDWDDALIEKLGLPRGIFQPIKTAGTVLGHLTPEIQKAVGFDAEVILPRDPRHRLGVPRRARAG